MVSLQSRRVEVRCGFERLKDWIRNGEIRQEDVSFSPLLMEASGDNLGRKII